MADDKITEEEQVEIDHLESIKSYTKSRINNPLILAYLISWVVFNWKFLLYMIFSDLKIEERFHHVDEYLDCWSWCAPGLAMVFYTFGMDWIEGWADKLKIKGLKFRRDQRKNDIIDRLKRDQDIADEKIKLLRAENIASTLESLKSDIEKYGNEIGELNYKIEYSTSRFMNLLNMIKVEGQFAGDLETSFNKTSYNSVKSYLSPSEFDALLKTILRDGLGTTSVNELIRILIKIAMFVPAKINAEEREKARNFGKYIINKMVNDEITKLDEVVHPKF